MSLFLEPCSAHSSATAGWRCTACQKLLCPQCAGSRPLGWGRLDSCLSCGGVAHPIRVRRALLHPFLETLPSAVRWPFTRDTALTALAAATVIWLFAKVGSFAALIADGILIAFMFHVVRHTAKGHDDLADPGDFRGFFEDVLGPIFRCLIASVWAWAPFIAYVMIHEGGFFIGAAEALNLRNLSGPLPVMLLLGGTLLFPMSLLAGALEVPLLQQLNPLLVIGYAIRLGRDYWLVSGFCIAVSIAESLLLRALNFIDLQLFGLPNVVFYFVLLFPPFMMFRALGLLVRARGDELGYGGQDSFLEPVLGQTLPATFLGPLPLPIEQERAEGSPGPVAEDSGPPEHGSGHGHVPALGPIELPDELASLPLPLVLLRRVAAEDQAGAVEVLLQSGHLIPAKTLSAQAWVSLSRWCLAAGRPQLALLSLLRAVELAPEGPLAPQAFLQAARLADESAGGRSRSNELLEQLFLLHPDSAEGRFAQKRLGR